jgi:hypothetical protein
LAFVYPSMINNKLCRDQELEIKCNQYKTFQYLAKHLN